MSEYVDIVYENWVKAFLSIDKSPVHGSSADVPSRTINYIAGSSMVTKTLDLKCTREKCCDLNVTILFTEPGAYLVPIPVGFDMDDEDLDLSVEDLIADEQVKPRGH